MPGFSLCESCETKEEEKEIITTTICRDCGGNASLVLYLEEDGSYILPRVSISYFKKFVWLCLFCYSSYFFHDIDLILERIFPRDLVFLMMNYLQCEKEYMVQWLLEACE
jgi:hypothetical protein